MEVAAVSAATRAMRRQVAERETMFEPREGRRFVRRTRPANLLGSDAIRSSPSSSGHGHTRRTQPREEGGGAEAQRGQHGEGGRIAIGSVLHSADDIRPDKPPNVPTVLMSAIPAAAPAPSDLLFPFL
jgi:hypothetical protein